MKRPPGLTTYTTLRWRLRADLKEDHDRLDRAVTNFDLRTSGGLAAFLRLQEAALTRLCPLAPAAGVAAAMWDLRDRARSDLASLGVTRLEGTLPPMGVPHPLSVDYVIAGSRLGSRILRARWEEASDPSVKAARAYMTAPDYVGLWREFCEASEQLPATGEYADRVTEGAAAIFRLYLSLCHELSAEGRTQHG